MASSSSSDTWMREYNEALKLSEDINGMMSERNSSALTGPDAQRRASAIRRKITILGTRLDSLQSLLVKVPGKQHVSEKEMNRRKDMVGNLRSKANQVASALNMSNFANRDSLLGPDTKPDDAINRVSGMDNQGIVGFQRQIMREQDEGLEKLEETVMSSKHIALAVNEELTLQTRLIDDLDYHVDVTDSRLRMDSSSTPNRDNLDNDKAVDGDEVEVFMTPDSRSKGKGKRRESPGASEETYQQKKSPRVLPTRSKIWNHFTRTKENRDRCLCHYCKKSFCCATRSGTSNLLKHIGICKRFRSFTEGQSSTQTNIDEDGTVKNAKVSATTFREATNEMMVIGQLPLSFIESVAWKHFCKKMDLDRPVSRRTSTRDIVELYVERKAAMKKWFKANKQRVSVTTDIWTAQVTRASYMVVTAHFIDDCWRLRKLILGFKHVIDHKGQTISKVLLDCLVEWGISKVFCVTVDNATANTSALRRFQSQFSSQSEDAVVLDGEFMHMRCCAHIINLIVKDGMADVSESVEAVRNAVVYVRASGNRLASFEQKVEAGKITRGSLPLDVMTRWNSTYLMLSTALKFQVAFDKMEQEDKLYNDYFLEVEKGQKRTGPPQMIDWKAIERLSRFLIIFYNSTVIVSASTSLNAFKCYGEIVTIAANLQDLSHSRDHEMKKKAVEMYKKFDKYWDGLQNINKMLIVATVFDPTKKMDLASMCFDELYGEGSLEGKEMYDSVIRILRSLFKEYSERYGRSRRGDSDDSKKSSTQASQCSQQEHQSTDTLELVEDGLGYKRIDRKYKKKLSETGVRDKRDELDIYLKEAVENPDFMLGVEYDVLSFWKRNCTKFPVLSLIAKDVLALQVSSVASESAFSTSGRLIDPSRSCLTHYMIEVLMCTEQWLKEDIRCESRVITNAQILEEIEELEKLEREFAD